MFRTTAFVHCSLFVKTLRDVCVHVIHGLPSDTHYDQLGPQARLLEMPAYVLRIINIMVNAKPVFSAESDEPCIPESRSSCK